MSRFVRDILRRNVRLVDELVKPTVPATWQAFARPFALAHDQLTRIATRQGDSIDPDTAAELERFHASLFFNAALLDKYRTLRASLGFLTLDPTAKRLIVRDLESLESVGGISDPARFIEVRGKLARETKLLAAVVGQPVDVEVSMRAVLKLRHALAHLCGSANAAEEILKTRTLKSPTEVLAFLDPLANTVSEHVSHEMQEVRGVAAALGVEDLTAEVIKACSEHLRQVRFGRCLKEIEAYLPEHRLLPSLSKFMESLFGLHLCRTGVRPASQQAVVTALCESDGAAVGYLHFDLFDRPEKEQAGWLARTVPLDAESAIIECRFGNSAPEGQRRLTHEELCVLFHELGHALHHVLTAPDNKGLDGAWKTGLDVAEVPSRLMEEFAWNWDSLRLFTTHCGAGKPISSELFDELTASRDLHRGIALADLLLTAFFDLHLHYDYDPAGTESPLELFNSIRQRLYGDGESPFKTLPDSIVAQFASHYALGDYGYLYSEALAVDMFEVFEEQGALSRAVGDRLCKEILSVGSSRPFLQSFVAFCEREPDLRAIRLPKHRHAVNTVEQAGGLHAKIVPPHISP